jgi:hypothetical protein
VRIAVLLGELHTEHAEAGVYEQLAGVHRLRVEREIDQLIQKLERRLSHQALLAALSFREPRAGMLFAFALATERVKRRFAFCLGAHRAPACSTAPAINSARCRNAAKAKVVGIW